PAKDEPERLRLSGEVRTGLEVDEHSTIQKLSQARWLERKRQLEQLGGPCDVIATTLSAPAQIQPENQAAGTPKANDEKPAKVAPAPPSPIEIALKAEEPHWKDLDASQKSIRDCVVKVLAKKPTLKDERLVAAVYLLCLGRTPTDEESKKAVGVFAEAKDGPLSALKLTRELVQRADFHRGNAAANDRLATMSKYLAALRNGEQPPKLMTMDDSKKIAADCAVDMQCKGQTDEQLVDVIFLLLLARFPTADEAKSFVDYLAKAADKKAAVKDLPFGLMNTQEFMSSR
ncbi:MAG TPA: hypothetical protein PLV92_01185, partial [Pirellulaceae bacterium]|nr:hypothetical protein [Pirellulaceae bacterium]